MEQLAKAVLLAARIHEESWDQKDMSLGKDLESGEYTISISEAVDQAIESLNIINGRMPVYLLLTNSWNDAIEWAKLFEKEEQPEEINDWDKLQIGCPWLNASPNVPVCRAAGNVCNEYNCAPYHFTQGNK